jgi:adenine-specific DNA-methyltransferase
VIKYLGSKRRLVPTIASLARAGGARTALDLFTGTTRVAQALKKEGAFVTALDSATYSAVLAECYVASDAGALDPAEIDEALARLRALPPKPGYVAEVFCERARYFHPENGARIDVIRDAIEDYAGTRLYWVLLTSLLEAADRVDSTAGLQMAFLKSWAPRALKPLELRAPALLAGGGRAILGDALDYVRAADQPEVDFAYIDPPYNQHRYYTNYHVWETLVRWDAPEHYGVACKRADCRDLASRSEFNNRSSMPAALAEVVAGVRAGVAVVSYNNEAWLSLEELREICEVRGRVEVLSFESKRYVGAQIGIHDPHGVKVGKVSHLHNTEIMLVCGDADLVEGALGPAGDEADGARKALATLQ